MQKSRLPLVILLLILACVLCLCAVVTGFAVFQVIRSVTQVELPQMEALLPPETPGSLEPLVEPGVTPLPPAARAAAPVNRIVVQGDDGSLYTISPDAADRAPLTEAGTATG